MYGIRMNNEYKTCFTKKIALKAMRDFIKNECSSLKANGKEYKKVNNVNDCGVGIDLLDSNEFYISRAFIEKIK